MQINPYLFFNGTCKEAFEFYAKVLGAKIEAMMPHKGTPAEEHVAPEWHDKIIHACLVSGDFRLMASDGPPDGGDGVKGCSVAVHPETPEEAERLFKELSAGGKITMPMGETFFSKRFGMLVDKFGTPWMVNCAQPM